MVIGDLFLIRTNQRSPITNQQRITNQRSRNHQMDVVRQPNQGWIEVIVGSMFSGKSEELIRRLRRARIARQRVQVFKPRLDTRYSTDDIVSHSEMRHDSANSRSAAEILQKIDD